MRIDTDRLLATKRFTLLASGFAGSIALFLTGCTDKTTTEAHNTPTSHIAVAPNSTANLAPQSPEEAANNILNGTQCEIRFVQKKGTFYNETISQMVVEADLVLGIKESDASKAARAQYDKDDRVMWHGQTIKTVTYDGNRGERLSMTMVGVSKNANENAHVLLRGDAEGSRYAIYDMQNVSLDGPDNPEDNHYTAKGWLCGVVAYDNGQLKLVDNAIGAPQVIDN